MNIGRGLKAIVNVGFWIWIAIGALLIIGGINGGDTTQIFFGFVRSLKIYKGSSYSMVRETEML